MCIFFFTSSEIGLWALTSDTLPKLRHLQNMDFAGENCFDTVVNGLSVVKWFQFSNGDSLFKQQICKVSKPKITKLGQGVRS